MTLNSLSSSAKLSRSKRNIYIENNQTFTEDSLEIKHDFATLRKKKKNPAGSRRGRKRLAALKDNRGQKQKTTESPGSSAFRMRSPRHGSRSSESSIASVIVRAGKRSSKVLQITNLASVVERRDDRCSPLSVEELTVVDGLMFYFRWPAAQL